MKRIARYLILAGLTFCQSVGPVELRAQPPIGGMAPTGGTAAPTGGTAAASGGTAAASGKLALQSATAPNPEEDGDDDDRSDVGDTMREWIFKLTKVRSPGAFERNHEEVKAAFTEVTAEASRSTVRIMCDQAPSAIGTIVDAEGLILSKASELSGQIQCVLHDKRRLEAHVIARDAETDLALLKIDAQALPVIRWCTAPSPPVGSLLATTGIDRHPISIGIVSVAPRPIVAPKPLLGVSLDPTPAGVRVLRVVPGSSADRAGVQVDDIIRSINGRAIADHESLIREVQSGQPGDEVKLIVGRGKQELNLTTLLGDSTVLTQGERSVFQNNLGGPLSRRRAGFPAVLQHDSVLRPAQCGGPLIDLDGLAVGINIARAGRVESFALPCDVVLAALERLKATARTETLAARSSDAKPRGSDMSE